MCSLVTTKHGPDIYEIWIKYTVPSTENVKGYVFLDF